MLPILIVDDEPSIAQLIAMTLEPLGQPLLIAPDGERAADLLETQKFDLVILDVMLPGVDGFALMDYIAPTGTPVVFLTAKNAVADRVRGLKLGAYDYIVKPFAPPELLADMAKNGQIATQYVDMDGNPTMDIHFNPNTSMMAIEGITSPDGRVLGKMGHSERIGQNLYQNVPGEKDQKIFESGVAYFK